MVCVLKSMRAKLPLPLSFSWILSCAARYNSTNHNVSSTDKLQSGLKYENVCDVDEVAGIIYQQPDVNIFWSLVGEGPAHRDQPHVPVPRHHHKKQPYNIDQICWEGRRIQFSSVQFSSIITKSIRSIWQQRLFELHKFEFAMLEFALWTRVMWIMWTEIV